MKILLARHRKLSIRMSPRYKVFQSDRKGIASGDIDEDLRDFFLDSLKEMAKNFAKTLAGLAAVTIEKVWNAVVGVLLGAIQTATGIAL